MIGSDTIVGQTVLPPEPPAGVRLPCTYDIRAAFLSACRDGETFAARVLGNAMGEAYGRHDVAAAASSCEA